MGNKRETSDLRKSRRRFQNDSWVPLGNLQQDPGRAGRLSEASDLALTFSILSKRFAA
jgi:hypothetical protein